MLSAIVWVFIAVMTVLVMISVLVLAVFPFNRQRRLSHAMGFWWADVIIGLNPFWSLEISGLEHVDPRGTYVLIANHESMADIVLLYKAHIQFKWLAKKSLFEIPVFGWCMSLMGYIPLRRDEHSSIKNAYFQAARWLKDGMSVLFFPEGTRSSDGTVNPFKNGAFKLAIEEGMPILPIYIEGSRNLIQRGSWIFNSHAGCRLNILAPIKTKNFKPEDFHILRDQVREKLQSVSQKTSP